MIKTVIKIKIKLQIYKAETGDEIKGHPAVRGDENELFRVHVKQLSTAEIEDGSAIFT